MPISLEKGTRPPRSESPSPLLRASSSALCGLLVAGVSVIFIKTARPLLLEPGNKDVQKALDQYVSTSRSRLVAQVVKDAVARQKLKQVLQEVLRLVQRVRVPHGFQSLSMFPDFRFQLRQRLLSLAICCPLSACEPSTHSQRRS